MSGPKVVRVVTREELVAAGTTLLARLDAAVQQWQRDCGDSVKPADVQVTKNRRDALAAILAADKFAEFGQAAVKEIDFLQADAEQRRGDNQIPAQWNHGLALPCDHDCAHQGHHQQQRHDLERYDVHADEGIADHGNGVARNGERLGRPVDL